MVGNLMGIEKMQAMRRFVGNLEPMRVVVGNIQMTNMIVEHSEMDTKSTKRTVDTY